MKKTVMIFALIAGIMCGVFMLNKAADFRTGYQQTTAASAADNNNITAEYNNGILTIGGLEGAARVIQASYDTNGVLAGVKLYDAVNGENKIPAKKGDRLYIWDSITGLHPLYDKITITDENTTDDMGKTLIAYFSWSGNTEEVANAIHEKIGGDIVRIEPKNEYPKNNDELTEVARQEQAEKARPELKNKIDNIDSYDTIFLGHPIWLQDMPMILYSFLNEYNLSGKTVVDFGSYGGTGLSGSVKAIQESEPNAKVIEGPGVRDSQTNEIKTVVDDWFSNSNLIQKETTEQPKINASEIWNKYDKDPKKYEATYDGELENATGVVTYIGRDSHGTPSMEIADVKGGTSYVLGVFGSYDEMSAVSVGDTVTISGYFHIMSSENMVVLKQCQIKEIYKAEPITVDHVSFGSYYKTGTELEPIEWKVLESHNGKVLLLAQNCIDSLPWHNTREGITWDNCDLRAWLNGDFLQAAFTAEEQDAILLSDLDNGDDLNYGTPVGKDTKDKVFLLSGAELESYLPSSKDRTANPTQYAVSHGAYANESGDCAWWLRSPGMTATSPAYLSSAGDIGDRAHAVNEKIIGVRPAIWIDSAYMRSLVQN